MHVHVSSCITNIAGVPSKALGQLSEAIERVQVGGLAIALDGLTDGREKTHTLSLVWCGRPLYIHVHVH